MTAGARAAGPDDSADYRVSDRMQIRDAVYAWCRAVDRRDWSAVRRVFHEDGYDDHGSYQGDVDGLVSYLRQRHSAVQQSQHHVGNILIEFSGEHSALAESYVVAYWRMTPASREARVLALGYDDGESGPLDGAQSGRYLDQFERREGLWRIRRRTLVWESNFVRPGLPEIWRGNLPRHLPKRDADDMLYRIRRELGIAPDFGGEAG